jgi:hypothetical protein
VDPVKAARWRGADELEKKVGWRICLERVRAVVEEDEGGKSVLLHGCFFSSMTLTLG